MSHRGRLAFGGLAALALGVGALLWALQPVAEPPLRPEEIQQLEIRGGDSQLQLTRGPEGWRLDPGAGKADTAQVEGLIAAALALPFEALQGGDPPESAGLLAPSLRLTLRAGARDLPLSFGAPSPFDGRIWMRRAGQAGLTDPEAAKPFLALSARPLKIDTFRDHGLFPEGQGALQAVTVRPGSGPSWTLTGPSGAPRLSIDGAPVRPAHPRRARALLAGLQGLRAADFGPAPASHGPALATLELNFEGGPYRLVLYPPHERRLPATLDGAPLWLWADHLAPVFGGPGAFADQRLLPDFDHSALRALTVAIPGEAPFVLQKGDEGWRCAVGPRCERDPPEQRLLVTLPMGFAKLEAAPLPGAPLPKILATYTLEGPGAPPLRVHIGPPLPDRPTHQQIWIEGADHPSASAIQALVWILRHAGLPDKAGY